MSKVGRVAEIHFGWTDESPVSGTLGFLLFGEGNVPWMVRELIHRAEPDPSQAAAHHHRRTVTRPRNETYPSGRPSAVAPGLRPQVSPQ